MRKTLILLFFYLVSGPMQSQTRVIDSSHLQPRVFQPGRFNYNVSLGSEFATFSGSGSGFSNWITPGLSYDVNKRLRLGGGISVVNTSYFDYRPWYSGESVNPYNGNIAQATVFINGQYLVNDRLTIFGSAYKTIPLTKEPLPYNPFNPIYSNNRQGIDFNIGYKVGKNMYIQAGFRYSDGQSPYNSSPYGIGSFQQYPSFPGGFMGNPHW